MHSWVATKVHARARKVFGTTAELVTPVLTVEMRAAFPVHVPRAADAPRYCGSATEFLSEVAAVLGADARTLAGPGRERDRARIRRTIVIAWRMLGRRSGELCAALGICHGAAGNIIARASDHDIHDARAVLDRFVTPPASTVCEIVTTVPCHLSLKQVPASPVASVERARVPGLQTLHERR